MSTHVPPPPNPPSPFAPCVEAPQELPSPLLPARRVNRDASGGALQPASTRVVRITEDSVRED
jgi:hypothetical protein